METTAKVDRKPNPRKGANIFSVITFAFIMPTFRKGFRKDLEEEDITDHLQDHDSKMLGDRLEKAWNKELINQKKPSLWRALRRVFGFEFFVLGLVILFLELGVRMVAPLALSQLIKYYTQEAVVMTEKEAQMYAEIIVAASIVNVLLLHGYMLNLQHFGMKLRVACCSVIYRKSLKLSKSVLGGTTIGQMVNLLSNDVNRCDRVIFHAHYMWLCPLEVLVIVSILYYFLELASIVGVVFMLMFVPLQMYLGKKSSIFRLQIALRTDERVRLMNEIISGIQVIKMYTWEKPFAKFVAIARRLEMRHIRAASYIRGVIVSFSVFIPRSAVFLTILTYALLEDGLRAEYVFVVTSFYNILRQVMTIHFPQGIAEVAEFRISISRLQKFLLYDEIETDKNINISYNKAELNNKQKKNRLSVTVSEPQAIYIHNAFARWSLNSAESTLRQIDFLAKSAQLIAIIGPVGSGKTSLLHVILKELPLESGTLKVEGNVSYASQEPWVFAGTVRQNILFGQPMMTERYQKVIRVCALEQDLSLFPYADETLVGERGVTLSGGQRARVNLARAIYKEADIYLLDDPLSAVDTHVGKQLFENCIFEFLKNKCTVLVTHQLQYLKDVNSIYVLENGKISINGTYAQIKQSKIEFTKQLEENKENRTLSEFETTVNDGKKVYLKTEGAATEVKEHKSAGRISGDVYLSYFKAGGSLFIGLLVLSLFILTQVAGSSADYFLTYWVNIEQRRLEQGNVDNTDLSRRTCIYIYSGIVASLIVITLVRSYSFFRYCMTASTTLHNNMFSNIVQAPMYFYNTNSSGRILNRFSKDMGSIDEILPIVAVDSAQLGLTVVGITIVVSIANVWLIPITGVILILFYLLRIIYMRTSRSVKRLEGITRSPVFAHMNASLQGVTTIRAFEAQEILQKEFDDHQDVHSSVWYLFLVCSRAFGFWLDVICVFYIASVTFSFFLLKTEQYGGNVGLAITQAMSLTGMFQWFMRQGTELENQMTSVERVTEYTKIKHKVDPMEIIPAATWPEQGNINFESVSLRYSLTEPYVLKHLHFSIKSKEKVGIVGRTGAGKSSLIYAIFQLTPIEGKVLIDDIDISKVPLQNLRSKISIIPQEPVLFSGTLRTNLDPFDEYSDLDLWTALEEVELKAVVADLPSGLNDKVSEGGSNFSVGQRQLLCLARAIIRKNNILILDEATANVDPQTDALIQNTIRRKFAECTVLTIAHRLHTIMDSDKVLVMDAGAVNEFDHPHKLLNKSSGLFHSMVQKTGFEMAKTLTQIAEDRPLIEKSANLDNILKNLLVGRLE